MKSYKIKASYLTRFFKMLFCIMRPISYQTKALLCITKVPFLPVFSITDGNRPKSIKCRICLSNLEGGFKLRFTNTCVI